MLYFKKISSQGSARRSVASVVAVVSAVLSGGCEDLVGPIFSDMPESYVVTVDVLKTVPMAEPNADGYSVTSRGITKTASSLNDWITLVLPVGPSDMELSISATNCRVITENPMQVNVDRKPVARRMVSFHVDCE